MRALNIHVYIVSFHSREDPRRISLRHADVQNGLKHREIAERCYSYGFFARQREISIGIAARNYRSVRNFAAGYPPHRNVDIFLLFFFLQDLSRRAQMLGI